MKDDEGTIWFHNIDKLITRIKENHIEDKLPNGIGYCYRKQTKLELERQRIQAEQKFDIQILQNSLVNLPEDKKKFHEDQIDSLALAMYQEFDNIKAQTEILKEFEEVTDYENTNNAIRELYPDSNLTIADILDGKAYEDNNPTLFKSKHLTTRSSSTADHSRSYIEPYGGRNSSLNVKSPYLGSFKNNRSFDAYGHNHSGINLHVNKSSLSTISHSKIASHFLPEIKSQSPSKFDSSTMAKYVDPLGIRRLGVYRKHKFSVSNRSRGQSKLFMNF